MTPRNPEPPFDPRDEREARITALLLGELTGAEAAELRQAIERDPELTRLHDRLKQTIELLREAVASPADAVNAPPAPLKLSAARRESLLAQFKTVPLRHAQSGGRQRRGWFRYDPVTIAAVVLLHGLVLGGGLYWSAKTGKLNALRLRYVEFVQGPKDYALSLPGGGAARTGADASAAAVEPFFDELRPQPTGEPAALVGGDTIYLPSTSAEAGPDADAALGGVSPSSSITAGGAIYGGGGYGGYRLQGARLPGLRSGVKAGDMEMNFAWSDAGRLEQPMSKELIAANGVAPFESRDGDFNGRDGNLDFYGRARSDARSNVAQPGFGQDFRQGGELVQEGRKKSGGLPLEYPMPTIKGAPDELPKGPDIEPLEETERLGLAAVRGGNSARGRESKPEGNQAGRVLFEAEPAAAAAPPAPALPPAIVAATPPPLLVPPATSTPVPEFAIEESVRRSVEGAALSAPLAMADAEEKKAELAERYSRSEMAPGMAPPPVNQPGAELGLNQTAAASARRPATLDSPVRRTAAPRPAARRYDAAGVTTEGAAPSETLGRELTEGERQRGSQIALPSAAGDEAQTARFGLAADKAKDKAAVEYDADALDAGVKAEATSAGTAVHDARVVGYASVPADGTVTIVNGETPMELTLGDDVRQVESYYYSVAGGRVTNAVAAGRFANASQQIDALRWFKSSAPAPGANGLARVPEVMYNAGEVRPEGILSGDRNIEQIGTAEGREQRRRLARIELPAATETAPAGDPADRSQLGALWDFKTEVGPEGGVESATRKSDVATRTGASKPAPAEPPPPPPPPASELESQTVAPAEPADEPGGARTEELKLRRELNALQKQRETLLNRIVQEEVNTAIPTSSAAEIVTQATAGKELTLGQRFRRALGGEVERSAKVRVEKNVGEIAGLLIESREQNAFDPYWVETEEQVVKSKSTLYQAIDKLKLNEAWGAKYGNGDALSREETYVRLRKMVDAHIEPNGNGVVEIEVKSDSPDEAARIANAVAEAYRDSRLEVRKKVAARGVEALKANLSEEDAEIARVQEELRRLEKLGEATAEVKPRQPADTAPIPQPEILALENAFSTFSLNVSDVSFKLAGASLEQGAMPDPATVRSEEFINAFDYRDAAPGPGQPIAFAWERARYPFAHNRDLLRFSVQTAARGREAGRALNLVLLLDNSGSMERADRVRIIQECLLVLAAQLQPQDKVSLVTFARSARLWMDGAPGNQVAEAFGRVGTLAPEGGTNLEDAMRVGYDAARRHYLPNGVNRVVLLTDGAANLGNVDPENLKQQVEAQRKQGIALDCFGIGWEGYNDDLLEVLSRNGDGRYGFVNSPEEAATEFAGQLAGALQVAASDVKVQVEFNPQRTTAYRQIGYAKHQLKKEQFRDNTVDAAEIGAAESGNALYVVAINPAGEGPIAVVRVRYKVPTTGQYHEHEWAVPYTGPASSLDEASAAMRLAAVASAFSEWLVASPYAAEVTTDRLLSFMAGVPAVYGADARPQRLEWMIRQAQAIAGK